MYPGRTDFFLKQHEKAVRRPYGYFLIDLKTTTQDDCRLRTNVLHGEEGFNQAAMEENIPQELLRYLKQQNLSSDPLLPAMQDYKVEWMALSLSQRPWRRRVNRASLAKKASVAASPKILQLEL